MNQENIGKFIATCRRKQKLTQEQLAEKLRWWNLWKIRNGYSQSNKIIFS